MDFKKIQQNIKIYEGALILESLISRRKRHSLRNAFTLILLVLIAFAVLNPQASIVKGAIFIVFSILAALFLLEFFFNSIYFSIRKNGKDISGAPMPNFELAFLLYTGDERDALMTLIRSSLGKIILLRAGFLKDALQNHINGRKHLVPFSDLHLERHTDQATLSDYVGALLESDEEFSNALFHAGIQKSDFLHAAEWTERTANSLKEHSVWWGKESLKRIPGLAKDWAYGGAYILEKYELPLEAQAGGAGEEVFGTEELRSLEDILTKDRDANAVLVGRDSGEEMEILRLLAGRIGKGTVSPELEHQRIVLLDTGALVAHSKEKTAFESEFMKVLGDAISAGNIILCFDNFASFFHSAGAIGSDVVSVMMPYLESGRLKTVALSEISAFHEVIEPNPEISRLFEKVLIKDTDEEALVRILEREIEKAESRKGIFFTYGSLKAIENGASQYLDRGGHEAVINLLYDIAGSALSSGKRVVFPEDVSLVLERKTGIPQGKVAPEEKEKLLHLEELLHKRIIGQDEAVKAISNALRRTRSGIGNPKKPMGSFLFLGPTGVGKTETTKALAEAFFGSEDHILRLDMSEYKGGEALQKLIGSFGGQSGILSSLAREKPYGVLLLDEFEKTEKDVLNLFLSILDEGFFSDMSGKRVNMRNMIIIATSNAGSGSIWNSVKEGEDLESKKKEIMESIIESGIFKPELLNRFDAVILFHPLENADFEKVGGLALKKFVKRLAEKGVKLSVTPDLIHFLVRSGVDPEFGARSMNRVITDSVETLVAEGILSGAIPPGSEIEFAVPKSPEAGPLEVVVKNHV